MNGTRTAEVGAIETERDVSRDACLRKTLAETADDKDKAARRLGISRATLYRELRRAPALS
ncbi:helix-turn-helix domain-containing protein [Variovorax sp. LARHSF232]